MPTIEITSRVTRRSLMGRSKDVLATRVLELMDELASVRNRMERAEIEARDERARREIIEADAAAAKAWARHGAEKADRARQADELTRMIQQVAAAAVSPPARTRDADLPAVWSAG
ncbi:MAG: hypothetical protein PGN33_21970 [Methylobacterium radiotolerans]